MTERLTDEELRQFETEGTDIPPYAAEWLRRLVSEIRSLRAENQKLKSMLGRPAQSVGQVDERPPTLSGYYSPAMHLSAGGHDCFMSACLLCGAVVFRFEDCEDSDFRMVHYNWHVSQGHRIP